MTPLPSTSTNGRLPFCLATIMRFASRAIFVKVSDMAQPPVPS